VALLTDKKMSVNIGLIPWKLIFLKTLGVSWMLQRHQKLSTAKGAFMKNFGAYQQTKICDIFQFATQIDPKRSVTFIYMTFIF